MKTLTRISTQVLDLTDAGRRREEDPATNENLLWWAKMTEEEEHMLTLTIEDIKKTLLMAIFAFNEDGRLVAAAGIFLPRTWNQSEPYLDGKKVVEIGTNYVLPEYRKQGIGGQLIEERLRYSHQRNWAPVSISSNEVVHKAFNRLNGSLMENDPRCSELRDNLCLRCEDKENCKCCPLMSECGWIFEQKS